MAITQYNYSPGVYEAITDEALDDSPVLNTWYYFAVDGWDHTISNVVLKQGGSAIPESAYELTIDQKYTDSEENESAKTLYAMWRIVDDSYDLIATTVSGNNFGSYVDNENIKAQLDAFSAELSSFTAADVSYNNSVSGLAANEVQAAIDEVVAGGAAYIPPTLSSETTVLTTSKTSTGTNYFTVKDPSHLISTGQNAIVEISGTGGNPCDFDLYLSSSITGSESGSSSWASLLNILSFSTRKVYLILPIGRYAIYSLRTAGSYTLSVKYKIIDTKLSYS